LATSAQTFSDGCLSLTIDHPGRPPVARPDRFRRFGGL